MFIQDSQIYNNIFLDLFESDTCASCTVALGFVSISLHNLVTAKKMLTCLVSLWMINRIQTVEASEA